MQSVCLDSDTSWYHGEVTDDPAVVASGSKASTRASGGCSRSRPIDNASLLERAVLETRADEVFETALRSVGTLLG